ncbi:hypothetical protein D1B33_07460 [Lysinibacillus yapensis]|uniref:HK97 gp10 family phage protein n=1 Tax=Ureibacillus yapensis TaxID=2304605 RepID=A0A396SC73_9BACL|nr:hypothetical protein [Lysinibacillus yapensis]RHW38702.1 hypothetical protein D1B33_07460 [Lysinibacillus yapensis]
MIFELDYREIQRLQENIRQLPNRAEKVINQTLHTDGVKLVESNVTRLIPVSNRNKNTKWYREHGSVKHAKDTKWSISKTENLGFILKSKGGAANKRGSFGYLVFPDEGRGQEEQNFTERATDIAVPQIMSKLHGKLIETIGGNL